MSRLEKKILVWILVCAGLLIAVLYSPMGSPNMYSDASYHVDNTAVRFGGRIQNASSSKGFSSGANNSNIFNSSDLASNASFSSSSTSISAPSNDLGVSLEGVSTEHKKVSYKVATPAYTSPNSNATYTVQTSSTIANTNKSNNTGGGGGSVGGGMSGGAIFANNNNSSNNDNTVTQNYGFSAITLDLSIFDELTNRQGASNENPDPVTDPGEEPVGPPIPVPDGFWFMLLLGVSYVVWKLKFK